VKANEVGDEITAEGPDRKGIVRVYVPPQGFDCSWVILFRQVNGRAVYADMAYTYDKTQEEDPGRIKPMTETLELARGMAEAQFLENLQPQPL